MKSRKPILAKLTTKYILQHISPEDIFSYYWGIPTHEISYCINTGKSTFAPYRDDVNRPSLGFYIKGDKLYARDFGGYFWGDCFDAAAFTTKFGNTGSEFGKLLERIAKDFSIHRYSKEHQPLVKKFIYSQKHVKTKIEIKISKRNWNNSDANYWKGKYGINSSLLEEYYVYPVDIAFVNGLLCYTYNINNPCYAYYFGNDVNGIENWKLYFPFADKSKHQRKFMQNSSSIEGALRVKKAKVGIITKSYKDVIAIESIARIASLSLLALATPSESTILSLSQYNSIMNYVEILYTLSDYDRTGIKFAANMRRKYNTIPLLFTKGLFGKPDFKAKDYSDNLEKYGVDNMERLTTLFCKHGHKDFFKLLKDEF
jgi:hypothetical protein